MSGALAVLALALLLAGFGATEASAERIGPLCLSVVVESFFLPVLLLVHNSTEWRTPQAVRLR